MLILRADGLVTGYVALLLDVRLLTCLSSISLQLHFDSGSLFAHVARLGQGIVGCVAGRREGGVLVRVATAASVVRVAFD
ncbi:hypothetical protein LY76DRAFT_341584 [Colletotrichum caudatum]|nr:hypothetical protein LY76DRAFT_341584 [Colletotrichum caudatum]